MGRNRKHIQAARAKQASRNQPTFNLAPLLSWCSSFIQMTQTHKELVKLADARVATRFSSFLADADGSHKTRLVYDSGLAFLEGCFPGSLTSQAKAAESPLFWGWFRNQWAIVDSHLNALLYVDKAGVMQYTTAEHCTRFIHGTEEFREFYDIHHQLKIGRLGVPAEFCAMWVATSTKPD